MDTFQLNEAYEEVDEQKRDVAQWKKKTQKANSKDVVYDELTTFVWKGEINDTRVLLEEQNEKNELLERKFRKVDSELLEVSNLAIQTDKRYEENDSWCFWYFCGFNSCCWFRWWQYWFRNCCGGVGNDGGFLWVAWYSRAGQVQNHDNPRVPSAKTPQSRCFSNVCQMDRGI